MAPLVEGESRLTSSLSSTGKVDACMQVNVINRNHRRRLQSLGPAPQDKLTEPSVAWDRVRAVPQRASEAMPASLLPSGASEATQSS